MCAERKRVCARAQVRSKEVGKMNLKEMFSLFHIKLSCSLIPPKCALALMTMGEAGVVLIEGKIFFWSDENISELDANDR